MGLAPRVRGGRAEPARGEPRLSSLMPRDLTTPRQKSCICFCMASMSSP